MSPLPLFLWFDGCRTAAPTWAIHLRLTTNKRGGAGREPARAVAPQRAQSSRLKKALRPLAPARACHLPLAHGYHLPCISDCESVFASKSHPRASNDTRRSSVSRWGDTVLWWGGRARLVVARAPPM